MTDVPHPIWTAMERAIGSTPGQEEALLGADRTPRGLSPWAFWVLIGLVRQRARQAWALETVRQRLGISVAEMAASRKTYAITPADGVVPGLIDWAYQVGGWMFQLTHRLTGEIIRVACYDDTGQVICGRYCAMYLANKRSPEPPERRLLELHPSCWTMGLAERELQRADLLLPFQNELDAFTLPQQVVDRFDLVSAFCQAWCDDARRPGAAFAVGDWTAAAPLLSESKIELGIRILSGARASHRRRVRMLMKRLWSKTWGTRALTALGEIDLPSADIALGAALAGRREDLVHTALRMIGRRGDPAWCPRVGRLFERLDPNRSPGQAQSWRLCAKILLKHGFKKRSVLKRLRQARRFDVARVALLALRYDPFRAPRLFLRALRSSDPCERTTAAAILAVLDEGWSRRLILGTLSESDDIDATAECRSALAFSGDPAARRAAEEWERQHESEPELESQNFFVSLGRSALDDAIQATMDEFHSTVLPLRGRIT